MNYGAPSHEAVKGAMLRALSYGVKPFGLIIFTADVADGETITIGDVTFEFDADSDAMAGNVAVDVSGGVTAADAVAAIKAAINGLASLGVTAADGNHATGLILTFTDGEAGNGTLALAETMAQAGNVVQSIGKGADNRVGPFGYVVAANDVTEGQVVLTVTPPPGRTLYDASVSVVSVSAGAVTKKAWDGAYAIDTNVITIDNSGATDFAVDDILVVDFMFS